MKLYRTDHLLRWSLGNMARTYKVEYAMTTVTSVVCPSRRIASLMSAHGRFLECQNCFLRVQFAADSHYEVIARQFESHSCGSPIPSEDDAPRVA
jgi:hypothetical protein